MPVRMCLVGRIVRVVVGDQGIAVVVASKQEDANQRLVVADGCGRCRFADGGEVECPGSSNAGQRERRAFAQKFPALVESGTA